MEVIVYTKPGDEHSRRIKELLAEKGVTFQEHVCSNGKVDSQSHLQELDIEVSQVPLTVVDGVAIPGMNRAKIEQAIGWVGS
jgi:glutaredoxin